MWYTTKELQILPRRFGIIADGSFIVEGPFMSRVWMSAAIVLTLVVGVILNVQEVVSADQAVVSKGGGPCGIFAGSEEDGTAAGGAGEITMVLENADKVIMKCKGTGLFNPTGMAQSSDGFPCGIFDAAGQFHLANESHATVSASGNGSMTCTFYK
jgi:hypothetical protein